ncbi:uncharacterized protein LOC135356356 [Latimeria chalumnae]|uniref:uncharacterized protein LOC135356356 n=1 Tax=Latimeria chalumnae TaxID=7897 RepID=UPI00313BDD36
MPKNKDKSSRTDFFNVSARSTAGKTQTPPLTTLSAKDMTNQALFEQMNLNTNRTEAAIAQMDSKLDKLMNRMNHLEEEVGSTDGKLKETAALVKRCEETLEQSFLMAKAVVKENKTLKRWLEVMENQVRSANFQILGLPNGTEKADLVTFLEEWIPKTLNLHEEEEDSIYIERAFRLPYKKGPTQEQQSQTIIVKLSSERDQDKVLLAARKKTTINFENSKILFLPDLGPETQQRRKALNEVKNHLIGLGINAFIQYPAKLKVIHEDKSYIFWDPSDAERFALGKKCQKPLEEYSDTDLSDTE